MDSVSSHSVYVLQQLQEQRIQGLLCDCMLVVKGVCFKAHKNVLAAFSAYFRSLFQNSPAQKSDVFHLAIQDVGGIGQVLDYMYTSHLELNQDNVHALMEIGQSLQVLNILNMCQAFLKPCASTDASLSLAGDAANDQDGVIGGTLASDTDLHKPLPHGYKLRNFYTRQYLKQSCSFPPEEPLPTSAPAADPAHPCSSGPAHPCSTDSANPCSSGPAHTCNTDSAHPCSSGSTHPCSIDSSHPCSSVSSNPCVSDSAHPCSSDSAHLHVLRPKKTVYLKKFNYLRSHVSVEEEGAEHCDPQVATPTRPAHASDLSVTSDPAGVSELKMAAVEEPSDPRGHAERSEVSSGNKYCCEVCGKTFKHPSNLELHKRSHTGEKPFQCNVCGKGFSQAGNLQTHLRRHSGEKPYICELCGKSFAASGDVQRHIIVHSGARPHLCDICGRGFSNFSNLKEHKKTHSTEKEFTCEQCGKSFNMQRKLFKHKLRHTGDKPYSCQTCGKCFAGSGDLQRHVRSHTGERPYTCDTCGKSFSRTAVLRRHRSSHCSRADADTDSCRSTEEMSSGALWGRAMKTLQNHSQN
ncbi:zinc finger and BTB domain-containing protein 49 isoform X1 [Puntigrus tetrazona]|uniref:zinc finger and BTB domain-containing protein 49 isoform X1 n=2 Tax=Puntigrus tetrazona TaxID=1606681 RepID=UPI001C8932CC|nr:zinc finger and BTB domain-containing protein 49 isoform X1 [Puntigrus tetrazona]XP_043087262.1 zinc finger and BTB domain-containing protein 49 isoform X1 [Puntigrus tetrazona]XP_043087263.1 zinc finger and BTB domain-containing protein 49 isoform X1 [Puntigrus tetrazona]